MNHDLKSFMAVSPTRKMLCIRCANCGTVFYLKPFSVPGHPEIRPMFGDIEPILRKVRNETEKEDCTNP